MAVFVPVFLGLAAYLFTGGGNGVFLGVLLVIGVLSALKGFTVVGPNESRVLTFFGKYVDLKVSGASGG